MKYLVQLTAIAYVKQSVEVEATTPDEAEAKAKEQVNDGIWVYDGLHDEPGTSANLVTPIGE
jgi:hypothetical protein